MREKRRGRLAQRPARRIDGKDHVPRDSSSPLLHPAKMWKLPEWLSFPRSLAGNGFAGRPIPQGDIVADNLVITRVSVRAGSRRHSTKT